MVVSEMCDNGEKKKEKYQASAANRGRAMHSDGALQGRLKLCLLQYRLISKSLMALA